MNFCSIIVLIEIQMLTFCIYHYLFIIMNAFLTLSQGIGHKQQTSTYPFLKV